MPDDGATLDCPGCGARVPAETMSNGGRLIDVRPHCAYATRSMMHVGTDRASANSLLAAVDYRCGGPGCGRDAGGHVACVVVAHGATAVVEMRSMLSRNFHQRTLRSAGRDDLSDRLREWFARDPTERPLPSDTFPDLPAEDAAYLMDGITDAETKLLEAYTAEPATRAVPVRERAALAR